MKMQLCEAYHELEIPQETAIESLTVDQLRNVWKLMADGVITQTQFSKKYGVNQGNFSRWLLKKKNNPASIRACRNYILSCSTEVDTSSNNEPMTLKSMNSREILDIVKSREALLAGAIFIDGDNSEYAIKEYVDRKDLHVIIHLKNGKFCSSLIGIDTRDNVSIIHSSTRYKDAADTTLSTLSSSLNMIIRDRLEFVLISKDHFIRELAIQLTTLNPRRRITMVTGR